MKKGEILMPKRCDHKSVGILVWRGKKLLLIERKKPPFGFAPPAGHVDGDNSFEEAAKRELKEEVGLEAKNLKLLTQGKKESPCRRQGGTWHYWKIYRANAGGKVQRSQEETKQVGWCDKKQLRALARKTEKYLQGAIKEDVWQKSPGFEPVWQGWLKQLKII